MGASGCGLLCWSASPVFDRNDWRKLRKPESSILRRDLNLDRQSTERECDLVGGDVRYVTDVNIFQTEIINNLKTVYIDGWTEQSFPVTRILSRKYAIARNAQ